MEMTRWSVDLGLEKSAAHILPSQCVECDVDKVYDLAYTIIGRVKKPTLYQIGLRLSGYLAIWLSGYLAIDLEKSYICSRQIYDSRPLRSFPTRLRCGINQVVMY